MSLFQPARCAVGLTVACLVAAANGGATTVEFNRDIRPILSDRCFACHGPDAGNRKSPLRLDIEADARKDLGKGRFGIVPGDPERSEVYKRIASANKALRMPPAYAGHDALRASDIELIRQWIEQGAKWEGHWAFLAPVRPEAPALRQSNWVANPIDGFVLARLEKEGLRPSPEADRTTLIRRVTLDLTGLPPTPAEVRAFLDDTAPGAYERVVDRLLSSSRYAERMAIRWLEAARYADTNGYQTDGPRSMWRWRDWVIGAFHRNMPFDRFTIEQIAGDLLPNATLDQKIATGFHRNHRTTAEGGIVDEEFRVEYVADRVETTATVWLGLTLGCARCHDHKYDPFSQRDFYRLFAFYNNVPEKGFVYNFGNEPPYVKAPTPEQQRRLDALDAGLAAARKNWDGLQPELAIERERWVKKIRKRKDLDWTPTEGLLVSKKLADTSFKTGRQENLGETFAKFDHRDPLTLSAWVKARTTKGAILTRYEDDFEAQGYGLFVIDGKLRYHYIFRWTDLGMRIETKAPLRQNEWQHVAVTYDGSMLARNTHLYVDGVKAEANILFDSNLWPNDYRAPLRIGAGAGLGFDGDIGEVRVWDRALTPTEISTLPLKQNLAALAAIPASERTPAQSAKLELAFVDEFLPEKLRQAKRAWRDAQARRDDYYDTVQTVMVMAERDQPRDTFVLKRGAYDAPGDKVTAAVPASLPPMKPDWPANRLGLARWLVDRSNPLTARVAVNRYWQMLFGAGLVKTLEDFGSQGEWPLHRDLLDWLAVEFMDSGWDIKHILKTIVTSSTYRQSSKLVPDAIQRDPENRLLARGPRLRLAAEVIRDQALAVSGLLVDKVGGPSVRPYQPPGLWQELAGGSGYEHDKNDGLYRRSLYTYWKRTIAPPSMVTFDSPTRETCSVRYSRTNTPLQALNLMNDITFVEAARRLGERMVREGGGDRAARVSHGYLLALGRQPKTAELNASMRLLDRLRARYSADSAAARALLEHGESKRDPSIPEAEAAAYTGVASLILNLDETVTKE